MKPLLRAAFRTYGTLMPDRAARSFERLLLLPQPARDIDVPEPRTTGRASRVPYAHGWLRLTEYGEGDAVLLLHGWGGRSASMRAFIDPIVDRGLRAVTLDLPAHGESSGRRTNLIECAGALLQVERRLGPVAAAITHSFGGPVAAFAWSHGFRAERMVMLAPPVNLRELMLPVATLVGLPIAVGQRALDTFARRLDFEWEDLLVDRLVSSMDAPLLVVHDTGDHIAPWSHGERIARGAPNGSLHSTDGLGHRNVLVEPAVIETVTEYITRHER